VTTTPARYLPTLAELEARPVPWLAFFMRRFITDTRGQPVAFAPHHLDFWSWIWSVPPDRAELVMRSPAFVGVWARGGAKSTSAEMAAAALGALRRRHYAIYVSSTQVQADDHVENVSAMLTGDEFESAYPAMADRAVLKVAARRGAWRRARLQTAAGFVIDAVGLDRAVRGLKLGKQRPDLIVLDDIDDENDSPIVTERKLRRITRAVLPAGAQGNTAVIAIQNLLIRGGVFDQIAGGARGVLSRRVLSGPIPAVRGLTWDPLPEGKARITGGEPTWPAGQSLAVCQSQMDQWTLEAFLIEAQHEIRRRGLRIYPAFDEHVHAWRARGLPRFVRAVGGLDFGGEGENANESAGLVAGEMASGQLVLLSAFKERGQGVARRQMAWMRECEDRWRGPGSVQWAGDATELLGLQLLGQSGFNVRPSKAGGKEAMREARIRLVGGRLALNEAKQPGLYYLPDAPRMQDFVDEITHYRRREPREGDETSQPVVYKRHDHLMSALEYLCELVDGDPWVDLSEEAYPSVSWT